MIAEISKIVEEEKPTETYNIPDGLIMEFLANMGVSADADIRKSDLAKIKVAGRRAMRKYIRKKYLKADK
ncbi:hypothetical protein C4588_01835 [Candidatus Parcubacteria bacterium]|nr:MAG: hypothetical protein C4588_01835 [Candidatus Parcubacteria bacterium]